MSYLGRFSLVWGKNEPKIIYLIVCLFVYLFIAFVAVSGSALGLLTTCSLLRDHSGPYEVTGIKLG